MQVPPQVAESLERVRAALSGTLGHGGRGRDFTQIERPPPVAERFENGQCLFDGLVIERICLADEALRTHGALHDCGRAFLCSHGGACYARAASPTIACRSTFAPAVRSDGMALSASL